MKHAMWISAFVLSLAGVAHAEDSLKLESLPEAVRKTVLKTVGDGKILEIEKEDRESGPSPVYEVEFVVKKVQYEALISVDGKLLKKFAD
jgi:hypothetical protein